MEKQFSVPEEAWKALQQHLGYSDEELAIFKKDPRWHKVLSRGGDMAKKTVVFEVVESHGCNIKHGIGDKFYFSAIGYMLAHKGPKNVCPYILPGMARIMTLVQDRLYEGIDPTPLFNRASCDDIGIKCGGWGRVIIEAKIQDREK